MENNLEITVSKSELPTYRDALGSSIVVEIEKDNGMIRLLIKCDTFFDAYIMGRLVQNKIKDDVQNSQFLPYSGSKK